MRSPENLQLFWDTNNNLNITWQYPNRSNGIIQTFNIKITPLSENSKPAKKAEAQLSVNGIYKQSYSVQVSQIFINKMLLIKLILKVEGLFSFYTQ